MDELKRLGLAIKIALDNSVERCRDIVGATNAEKDMQKANFASEHSDWPVEDKKKFNQKWARRDSFPPHVPGSPKVFSDV